MLCALQAGHLTLEECDVTSQSGVGVGVEGAAVTLAKCSIHDCERHGVAVFGSLEGEGALSSTSCSVSRGDMTCQYACTVAFVGVGLVKTAWPV
jgi:hypothetical protein